MSSLSNAEIRRYSRHLLLPEVSLQGQQRLKAASVLVLGTGGLGSPLGLYLAAAGVGRLGIADHDVVDESNLHRQVIHGQSDVGKKKVESAAARIKEVNPFVVVEPHDMLVTKDNALELFASYDVIADGTDNFPTRYLTNDACVLLGKPNVYASIFQFEGQLTLFDARKGPCYRCLFPEPPPPRLVPSCAEGGVLGVLPGVIGTLQATEVLKQIIGFGEPLLGRLLVFDAREMRFDELRFQKSASCPICGPTPSIRSLVDYEQFCGTPADDRMPAAASGEWEITPNELAAWMSRKPVMLVDVREPHERDIARIEPSARVPMAELPQRLHELDSADDIVLYCREGTRSMAALALLRNAGFTKVRHLKGGINAWSTEIDPDVPIY